MNRSALWAGARLARLRIVARPPAVAASIGAALLIALLLDHNQDLLLPSGVIRWRNPLR
jgi:hypothetical protein